MTTKTLSPHAAAAKSIRQELKIAFPKTTFRIRSSSFAGGDDVVIYWTDGPTVNMVDDITSKYRYGDFNGMIDLYEHTNCRDDIPQVKFVMKQRTLSLNVREAA